MFRASSAHLQEDTFVYMQHMVLSLYESSWWPVGTQLTLCSIWYCHSTRVRGGLSVHNSLCVPTGHHKL